MADLVSQSAQNIADALAPTPSAPSARWRWGTVVSVSNTGTMNVSIGGATVPGIRCAQHVMGAQVGDRVRVLYCGTEAIVDAVRATSDLMSVPAPSMDASTQAAWLSALGIEFGYSDVTGGRWDWVKLPNGLAICNYCDSDVRTVACTSQTGGIYWGQVWTQSGSPSFPITFIETPTLSASPSGSNNYFVQISHGDHTTGKVGDVYLCRSSSTTFNGKMHITAIGRWK